MKMSHSRKTLQKACTDSFGCNVGLIHGVASVGRDKFTMQIKLPSMSVMTTKQLNSSTKITQYCKVLVVSLYLFSFFLFSYEVEQFK
jgi:hypothetical protein